MKASPATISSDLALIDFNYADRSEVPQHRRTLAAFVNGAAKEHPRAIILDIPFGDCIPPPCTSEMTSSRRAFTDAVGTAIRSGVPVYANVGEIHVARTTEIHGSPPQLDGQIYQAFSGYGHTAAVALRPQDGQGGDLFYRTCYPIYPSLFKGRPQQTVWALVDIVLYRADILGDISARTTRICDLNTERLIAVRYGPVLRSLHLAEEYQISQAQPFPPHAQLRDKFVIVGVPALDIDPSMSQHPGSDLLTWIFNDELTYEQFANETLHVLDRSLPFMALAFSIITVFAFLAFFFTLGRLKLGAARRFLPWISAGLSICAGLVVFTAFEFWMLCHMQRIQPQISFVSFGIVLAAALSGVRGRQIEFERLSRVDDVMKPEENDYDVFVSYARDELEWVLENVYVPLKNVRANGRKLRIFFDTAEIRIGTAWQDKISMAIDGSAFIVPVYSDTYFSKPYCRFEIKRAHRKWIYAGERSPCVLPIMRGHPTILKTVDDITATSIDDEPDVVDQVIAAIIEGLLRDVPTGDPREGHHGGPQVASGDNGAVAQEIGSEQPRP